MATLRERVENHPVVFFLGVILAGFLAGLAAYEGVLNMSGQTLISSSRLADLEKLESGADGRTGSDSKMGPIIFDWDMHGEDIGGSLPTRYPGLCQNKCAENSDCKAWAFQPPNKCWLKDRIPLKDEQETKTNYASGIKLE